MRITTQGDYALRCILNIARNGAKGPVPISRIVEDESLPLDYIEQLLMKLRRNLLIKSVRGVKGGYVLNRRPGEISVKDVIEAVEGEAFEVICQRQESANGKKCAGSSACVLKDVWIALKDHIEGYLDKVTIRSLHEKSRHRRFP